MSYVSWATNGKITIFSSPNREKAQPSINKEPTKSHERKESSQPINGQEHEIDPHDAAPSLPELERHGHEPADEERRGDGTDERHGP